MANDKRMKKKIQLNFFFFYNGEWRIKINFFFTLLSSIIENNMEQLSQTNRDTAFKLSKKQKKKKKTTTTLSLKNTNNRENISILDYSTFIYHRLKTIST